MNQFPFTSTTCMKNTSNEKIYANYISNRDAKEIDSQSITQIGILTNHAPLQLPRL